MTDIELSPRERREYRLGRALLDIAENRKQSGLAFEVSEQLAKTRPAGLPSRGGLLVPYNLPMELRAGLDTATATKGQELKFTQAKTFIDALRKRAIVMRGGATVLEGLTADLSVPRGNATAAAVWASQNPGTDVSDSNLTLNNQPLVPKELIGTTSFSRQLLAQSAVSESVDELVKNDLAGVHASAIDLAALDGSDGPGTFAGVPSGAGGTLAAGTYFWVVTALLPSGETLSSREYTTTLAGATSSVAFTWSAVPNATGYRVYRGVASGGENVFYAPGNVLTFTDIGGASTGGTPPTTSPGQPIGVLRQAGVISIAFGVNGLLPTWPLVTSFEKNVAVNDGDVDLDTMCYITTPEVRDRFRITDRQATSGWFIMDNGSTINDYPVLVSNQLPKNLTKGNSNACHPIIFGALSEIIIGFWAAFEIVPDPYRLKKQGMVEVTSYQLVDVGVRHAKAFAASTDVLP